MSPGGLTEYGERFWGARTDTYAAEHLITDREAEEMANQAKSDYLVIPRSTVLRLLDTREALMEALGAVLGDNGALDLFDKTYDRVCALLAELHGTEKP